MFLCSFFRKLAGCTLFITGASRGIGKAIALKAARDGANIVIAAKTTEPHPKLPGTIYTAAQEGEELTHRRGAYSRPLSLVLLQVHFVRCLLEPFEWDCWVFVCLHQ